MFAHTLKQHRVKVHLSTFRASRDAVFSILLSAKRFDPGGLLQDKFDAVRRNPYSNIV